MISVISYSGGKDSTALWLWAREQGIMPRRVIYADTRWENPIVPRYVAEVSALLREPVETLYPKRGFEERVRKYSGFPTSGTKWCTDELKVQPTAAYLDWLREETGDEVQILVGVRREESRKRAKIESEREWMQVYDCEIWRPLLEWKLADVIAIHHKHGVPLNPLYKLGAERVGCWPCINAGKAEIALVAEIDPERIDLIRELERSTKNTMFSKEARVRDRVAGERRRELPLPIDEAVAWARTDRGGDQIRLIRAPSGCARWGICEPPPERDE